MSETMAPTLTVSVFSDTPFELQCKKQTPPLERCMVNFAITQARSLVPPEATLLIWKGHHRGNIRIPETETPDQAIALVPDMKCEAVAEFPHA